jgi:hypothetical protein
VPGTDPIFAQNLPKRRRLVREVNGKIEQNFPSMASPTSRLPKRPKV